MATNHQESEWELSKENVQPLKQGRKFSSLTAALTPQPDQQAKLKEQTQKFEMELRTYTGDDPISVWYKYILWMEQNFPKGARNNLNQLLEQCVTQFKDEEKYKDDPRNLEIWIKFASLCDNPSEIYSFMFNNRIGSGLAAFYEVWASECETVGNTKQADSLYRQGIEKCAHPLGHLDKRHREFQARVAGRIASGGSDATQEDQSESRQHLAHLKAHGKQKKVGSMRTPSSRPAVLGTAPAGRSMSNPQGPGFSIFMDSENKPPQLPSQSGDWGSVPTRSTVNRENELKPGKWNESKLRSARSSHSSVPTSALPAPTFQIHEDEGSDLPSATPRKMMPEVNQVLSARKPQKPSNPLQHLMATSGGDVRQVPMYCKNLVYVGTQEFSIEEIRAAHIEKKQEEVRLLKLREEQEKVQNELRAQREQLEAMKRDKEIFEQGLEEKQRIEREKEQIETELREQRERLEAMRKERVRYEQELQKIRTTPSPPLSKVPGTVTLSSSRQSSELQSFTEPTPVDISGVEMPSVEVNKNMSTELPPQVGLVRPGIQTPQNSSIITPNQSGFTSSEIPSSEPTPDSLMQANQPSSYLSANFSRVGICAPSPTINTKEALKTVMGMFNSSLNPGWAKSNRSNTMEESILPASDMMPPPDPLPPVTPFSVFVEEDENQKPPKSTPSAMPFTVFADDDINKNTPVPPAPNDENRMSVTRPKSGGQRAPLGFVPQAHKDSTQKTPNSALSMEELEAKFTQLIEAEPLREEDDILMADDDGEIISKKRESMAYFDNGMDDMTFAPGVCSTQNFGNLAKLLPPTEDPIEPKKRIPFTDMDTDVGREPQLQKASLVAPKKADADVGGDLGPGAFLSEYTQPLRGGNDSNVLAGARQSIVGLDGQMENTMFAPPLSSTQITTNLRLASTPHNPNGMAPDMSTLPVSFISGDGCRDRVAEKMGVDNTLGVLITTHETGTMNKTAAISQNQMATSSLNQTDDSYGKKNLSPITELSDEDMSASHLLQTGGDTNSTKDGQKTPTCPTINEVEEIEAVENPRSTKPNFFNQTCHEIDVTNYVFEDDNIDLLSQSVMVSAHNDPFDEQLIVKLLSQVEKPIDEYPNYNRIDASMPTIKAKKVVNFGETSYNILQRLGEGAFARVYTICRQDDKQRKTKVVKVQTPACPWEFYIAQELHRRVMKEGLLMRSSLMFIEEAFFFNNGSCFVNELFPYGTLLDVVNVVRGDGRNLPESVILYICIEMLRILEAMMKVDIIHGDIKPDNYLFRGLPLLPENKKEALRGETQCLRLIDFGRCIDMQLFPPGTSFGVCVETSGFQCIEMKTEKPWTYQTDMFGVVGTMYVLIFGEYMNVTYDGQRWKPNTRLKRWFKSQSIMKRIFDELLNVESCENLPDIAVLREGLEDAFLQFNYNKDVHEVISLLNQA